MSESASSTEAPKRSFKQVAAERNRRRTELMAEEAFLIYIGLGVKRSYAALRRHLETTTGSAPSIVTIKRWANRPNADGKEWADRVEDYEAAIQQRLSELLIQHHATHRFDQISGFEKIAEIATRRVQAMLTGVADPLLNKLGIENQVWKPDEKNLFVGIHDLIELAEKMHNLAAVARGGVTGRIEMRAAPGGPLFAPSDIELARRLRIYDKRHTARLEGKTIEGAAAPVTLEEAPAAPALAPPAGSPTAGNGKTKPPLTLGELLPSVLIPRKKPNGGN